MMITRYSSRVGVSSNEEVKKYAILYKDSKTQSLALVEWGESIPYKDRVANTNRKEIVRFLPSWCADPTQLFGEDTRVVVL